MSVKNIILASVLAIVVLAAGSVIGCYFHYNNQEISLRQQSEAQRGKIEGVHDKMWKVLQQKAQVTDEYKSAFESIYPKLIEGRYSKGDGSLMKWIKESNPNFDVSLYKDLMQSIEIQLLLCLYQLYLKLLVAAEDVAAFGSKESYEEANQQTCSSLSKKGFHNTEA